MNKIKINKCKRCKYFDILDEHSGVCDKTLNIINKEYVCNNYKDKHTPPLK